MANQNNYLVYWVHLPIHTGHHQGYIGITDNFDRRMKEHKSKAPNKHFQNAINKYGWDNLVKEIITDNLTEKEALAIEAYLRHREHMGWNAQMGGTSPTKDCCSRGGKVQGKIAGKIAVESGQLASLIESKKKPVLQYLGDIFVAEHSSVAEAARAVNGSQGTISTCCLGNRKSHKGFRWRYKSN